MNNQELNNRLIRIEQSIKSLNERVEHLAYEMSKYATQGQLKTSEANLKNLINGNSQAITTLQEQIDTIVIPEQTRYYLSKSEVENFRSNYKSLISMITDIERLYQSLISYTATIK